MGSLRDIHPNGSLRGILYRLCIRGFCALWLRLLYRYRAFGIENLPRTGPLLIVANHQSHLDPVALGVGGWRRRMFGALARESLFKNPIFGTLIGSLNAIPIARGEADMKAMRTAIDLLKQGEGMLVFPEGTRTADGSVAPFKSGVLLLVRRAKATVVPAAVEGAYAVWPRERKLPRLTGRISVKFGEPITADELATMDPDAAAEMLRDRVDAMRRDLAS